MIFYDYEHTIGTLRNVVLFLYLLFVYKLILVEL